MAQRIKVPPAQTDDLSSISRTHMVEQDKTPANFPLTSTTSCSAQAQTLINKGINKPINVTPRQPNWGRGQ